MRLVVGLLIEKAKIREALVGVTAGLHSPS